MIAIYRLTAAGAVERAGTVTTESAARDALRGLGDAVAVAFDGGRFVASTWRTRVADVDALRSCAVAPEATRRYRDDAESCQWPGCVHRTARAILSTPVGLVDFCTRHRRVAYENSRPLDTDSPRLMRALAAAVGPTACCDAPRGCAACKAAVRAHARAIAERRAAGAPV